MDVKALIVGLDVVKLMAKIPSSDLTLQDGEEIYKAGYYGQIPVWVDGYLPPGKLMVSYTLDSSGDEPASDMVRHWRKQLPAAPDGEDWILLSR